jgi:tetratricopeptide (TPR) repeat protein
MILNHPYYYLYYNELVGGLKGAYTNYETDYYYVSQTEASEWLIDYLKKNDITRPLKIKATYSVKWLFREQQNTETSYFRYEERSMYDWDYAIMVSRYVPPLKLINKTWPPENTIHTIYADNIPICAVVERKSKDDYYGYKALSEGKNQEAIDLFKKSIKINDCDEMIFFNFAVALYNIGEYQKADSVLKAGLKINPDFEPILMYLGNIAREFNDVENAIGYYEKVIKVNRKYFEAYVGLSELVAEDDVIRSRDLLRTCLKMNPLFKPAIVALADTYRDSDPEIAKKYDELANTIK